MARQEKSKTFTKQIWEHEKYVNFILPRVPVKWRSEKLSKY